MFRLAHISDIHLGPLPMVSRRELMSKRITGYVNWQRNRSNSQRSDVLQKLLADLQSRNPDHLAVTGDLINLGLDREISDAAIWLQSMGEPENVSVVCGNHDAYVPGALAKVLKAWGPYVSGDEASTSGIEAFPYVRRRDGVSIIGCNSARATMPFMATGFFRKDQAERLAQILQAEGREGRCRVVLIHHSPVRGATSIAKRLVGATLFRKVIEQHGAELVLHGHTHKATVHLIPGAKNSVPVVGVPAAGQAPAVNVRRTAARYNLFSIAQGPRGWSIAMNEYGISDAGLAVSLIAKRQLL